MNNPASTLFIGPTRRPEPRPPGMSYRCHLGNNATIGSTQRQHHRGCDGQSYGPALTSKGEPCVCPCHPPADPRPRNVPINRFL